MGLKYNNIIVCRIRLLCYRRNLRNISYIFIIYNHYLLINKLIIILKNRYNYHHLLDHNLKIQQLMPKIIKIYHLKLRKIQH
jgi:hypothetical protein